MFEAPSVSVNLRGSAKLTILPTVARWLARQLAPPVCVLCGGEGQWLGQQALDLCACCEAVCQPMPPESLPFGEIFCLFEYRDPVDRLVTGLKFDHDLACARVLGMLLARARTRSREALPDCLLPMPLHASRYRERGFCQTRELARHIARRLRGSNGRPVPVRTDLLQRTRPTRPQSSLHAAERAANLAGAFAVRAGAPVPPHVALLDDVLTTGSTAAAAVAALKAGGATRVEIWCCARALRDNAAPFQTPSPPWPPPTPSPLPPRDAGGSTTS